MADDTSASIFTLHQAQPKRPKTAAERAKAYRERQKAATLPAVVPAPVLTPVTSLPHRENSAFPAQTSRNVTKRTLAPALLSVAALALAVVGMTMNGWFARSLGSTDAAGYLFLAIGVAADVVALVLPSCVAGLWRSRQRATALAGWAVWLATFAFAISAGIGFASVNISDVTLARSARTTPAIITAQAALADAMAARDRECKGGVGKWCREREAAVVGAHDKLDAAMASVGQAADPQTDAAIKMVAWVSRGAVRPAGDDFAMLRLILLALLPQVGGVLLMIAGARP